MVRDTNMGPQFLCNFDLDNREIISSPTLIILMYRAVSKCREYLLAYSQQNFESGNEFTDKALSGKDIKILS